MKITFRHYFVLFYFLITTTLYAGYNDMILTPYIQDSTGQAYLDGTYDISLGFVTANVEADPFICPIYDSEGIIKDLSQNTCFQTMVTIHNGRAVFELNDMDNLDVMITANLQFKLRNHDSQETLYPTPESDYLFNSTAYSILSYKTASVHFPQAETLHPSSVFISTVNIHSNFYLGGFDVLSEKPYLRYRSNNPSYAVDLQGLVNISSQDFLSGFYKNGVSLSTTLAWQRQGDDLFTLDDVLLNSTPFSNVHYDFWAYGGSGYDGSVFAHQYYRDGLPLLLFDSWKMADDNLYFMNLDSGLVGFGVDSLNDQVNANGILMMGDSGTHSVGSIYFKDDQFFGVKSDNMGYELAHLNVINPKGSSKGLPFFLDTYTLSSQSDATVLDNSFLGDFSVLNSSGGLLDVRDDFVVFSDDNQVLFGVNSGSGNIVLTLNNQQNLSLQILGGINAKDYYKDGFPLNLQLAQGEFFYKNPDPAVSSTDNYKIYYNGGHLVLGASYTSLESKSVLEISNPILDETLPTLSPAVTFTSVSVNNSILSRFSMGVDVSKNNQFVIVKDDDLGVEDPLMVIARNQIGIGISDSMFNLSVSGNLGFLFEGALLFFSDRDRTLLVPEFENSGTRLLFNPYGASFRAGHFLATENVFQNVGLATAGIGFSPIVKGNLSAAFGGVRNYVSGLYSVGMGGFSNTVLEEFSFGAGAGSQVDHSGSFVFSHGGVASGAFPYHSGDFKLEVEEASRFKTSETGQFIIGVPSYSSLPMFSPASMGINYEDTTQGLLSVKGKSILPGVLVDKLDISYEDATVLFDSLQNDGFLSSIGDLLVYDKRLFKEFYVHDTFSLIVSINSSEVFKSIVDVVNTGSGSQTITSINLKDWGIVPTDNWDYFYMPNISYSGEVLSPTFNRRDVGEVFYLSFVDGLVAENTQSMFSALKSNGIFDYFGYFKECNTYGISSWASTANLISEIVETHFSGVNLISSAHSSNFSTSNLRQLMALRLTNVSCNDWDEHTITLNVMFSKLHDLDHHDVDETSSNCMGTNLDGGSYYCHYTYQDYKDYLIGVIYPELFTDIRDTIHDYVINLDSISLGSYLISDFDDTKLPYPRIQNSYGVDITSSDVQLVLEELASSNILTLRGNDSEIALNVQNNGMVGVGYMDMTNVDLAVRDGFHIFEPRVSDLISTRSLLTIDNEYDSAISVNSFLITKMPGIATPSFIIDNAGFVGLDVVTTDVDAILKMNYGSVVASSFKTDQGTLAPPTDVVIIFQDNDFDSNIYFVSGNLGLGIGSPNSLLHLGYSMYNMPSEPSLIFDYNNNVITTIQTTANNLVFGGVSSNVFSGVLGFKSNANLPGFLSVEPGVVSGNLSISHGSMLVNSSNDFTDFSTNTLKTQRFYVRYRDGFLQVEASGYPWNFDDDLTRIYKASGTNIGIGSTTALYDLHVSGNFGFVQDNSSNMFRVLDSLVVDELKVSSNSNASDTFLSFVGSSYFDTKLKVDSGDLILDINGTPINQTNQLTYGVGSIGDFLFIGNLLEVKESLYYRVDNFGTILPISPSINFLFDFEDVSIPYWFYDDSSQEWQFASSDRVTQNMSSLSVTGSFDIDLDNSLGSGSSTVNNRLIFPYFPDSGVFGSDYYGIYYDSTIRYDGLWWEKSYSHSFTSFNISIANNSNWVVNKMMDIRGLDISIDTVAQDGTDYYVIEGSEVVGLYSDLTDIVVQNSAPETRGYSFPGIFMGDVLISHSKDYVSSKNLGVFQENPMYSLLDVNGSVLANGLVISDRLMSPTLQAGPGIGVNVANGRVGIEIQNPTVALEVLRSIQGETALFSGLISDYLSHNNDRFNVSNQGLVGFGLNHDDDSIGVLFSKQFNSYNFSDFKYKSYHINVSEVLNSFDQDITGLDISFSMDNVNFFGNDIDSLVLKALDINLEDILIDSSINEDAEVYGLNVEVPVSQNSYAAVFLDGYVGIGNADPNVALDIDGAIRAGSYQDSSFLFDTYDDFVVRDLSSFTSVYLPDVMASHVSVNTLIFDPNLNFTFGSIQGGVLQFNLDVSNRMGISTFNMGMVTTSLQSVSDAYVLNRFVASSGTIYSSVRPSGSNVDYVFDVNLDVLAPSINLTNSLDVGSLVVSNNQNEAPLLMVSDGYFYVNQEIFPTYNYPGFVKIDSDDTGFIVSDVDSWNAMGLFSGVTENNSFVAASIYPHSEDLENWVLLSKLLNKSYTGDSLTKAALDLSIYNFGDDVSKTLDFTNSNGADFKSPFLYFSSTGNVFLSPDRVSFNDSQYHSTFNVFGNAEFRNSDGDIQQSISVRMPSLNVSVIDNANFITLGSSQEQIVFDSFVTVNSFAFLSNYVHMDTMALSDYHVEANYDDAVTFFLVTMNNVIPDLWVNSNQGDRVISFNLMHSPVINNHSVLVFSDRYRVTPSSLLVDNMSLDEYRFDFDNHLTSNRILLQTFLSDNAVFQNYVPIKSILATLDKPVTAGNPDRHVTGLRLDIASSNAMDTIGIRVAMDVSSNTNFQYELPTNGEKYAALFNGGSVLMTSRNASDLFVKPSANVHVAFHHPTDSTVKLSQSSFDLFIISGNRIQLGQGDSESLTSLFGLDIRNGSFFEGDSIFTIGDRNENDFLRFLYQGDRFITIDSRISLGVMDYAEFQDLHFDTFSMDSTDVFSFDHANAFIGVGIGQPQAQFHVYNEIPSAVQAGFSKSIYMTNSVSVLTQNMTGFSVSLSSNLFNSLDNGDVKGMDIDMKNLQLHKDSSLYGLYVDVTDNMTVSASSIVFVTGNVGIGLDDPRDMLDVNGVLYVKHDVYGDNNYINVSEGVATDLYVSHNVGVNSDVFWDTISINGTLTFDYMFYENGQRYTFDTAMFDSQFNSSLLDIDSIRFVGSGDVDHPSQLMVSNNVMVGSVFEMPSNVALLFQEDGQGAYISDLILNDDYPMSLSTMNVFQGNSIISVLGGVTFNQGVFGMLQSPYFRFKDRQGDHYRALTVSSNAIWFGGADGSYKKLDFSQNIGSGYVPVLSPLGITYNTMLQITNNVFEFSGHVNQYVEIGDGQSFSDNIFNHMVVQFQKNGFDPNRNLNVLGLKIEVVSDNAETRYHSTIQGLVVSMNKLLNSEYDRSGVIQGGSKFAALFEGGDVLIVRDQNEDISGFDTKADMYVSSNRSNTYNKTYGSMVISGSQSYNGFRDFFIDVTDNVGFSIDRSLNDVLFVDIGVSRNQAYSGGAMVQIATFNESLIQLQSNGQDIFSVTDDTVFIGPILQSNKPDISFHIAGRSNQELLVSMNGFYIDKGLAIVSSDVHSISDRVSLLDVLINSKDVIQPYFRLEDDGISGNVSSDIFFVNGSKGSGNQFGDSGILSVYSDVYHPIFVGDLQGGGTDNLYHNSGFLASGTDGFMGVGITRNSAEILVGGQSFSVLSNNDTRPLIYVENFSTPNLGVFNDTLDSRYQFHLDRKDSLQHYLNVSDGMFIVNSAGNVGIGTQNFTGNLVVDGAVRVESMFQPSDLFQSSLTVYDGFTLSSNDQGNVFSYVVTHSSLQDFTLIDIQSQLGMDVTKNNIMGYGIFMPTDNSTHSLYGIYIDMDTLDVLTDDESFKYGAVFNDSSVVVDLVPKNDYEGSVFRNASCMEEQMHLQPRDYNTCLNNVRYFYPLTIIASANVNPGVDYVNFTQDNSNYSFDISFVSGGDRAINKVRGPQVRNDYPYLKVLDGSHFVNAVSNKSGLQQTLLDIEHALLSNEIIDLDGQVNMTKLYDGTYDSITGIPVKENVLAVLENFATQNVVFARVTYNYIQKTDSICVPKGDFLTVGSSVLCAHSSLIAEENEPGVKEMLPLAFSTSVDPVFLNMFNVARVGINLATDYSDFENGLVTFSETLVIGTPRISSDYDYIDSTIDLSSGDSGTFIPQFGFFDSLSSFASGRSFGDDTIHDFVDADQHSITIQNKGSAQYRYMSYKTRYHDIRIGAYQAKTQFGASEPNPESRLVFSGGPCISYDLANDPDCSDNGDTLSMGRLNALQEVNDYNSKFIIDLNDSNTVVAFQAGFEDSDRDFTSPFVVGLNGDVSYVGIGSLFDVDRKPMSLFHVNDYPDSSLGDYINFFGVSSASGDRFYYTSRDLADRDFNDKFYSMDDDTFGTSLRSASDEGAGCDGDYRVYHNYELQQITDVTSADWTNYYPRAVIDNSQLIGSSNANVSFFSPNPNSQTIMNNINYGQSYGPKSLTAYDMDPQSRESIYSCHYYYWIVESVLNKNPGMSLLIDKDDENTKSACLLGEESTQVLLFDADDYGGDSALDDVAYIVSNNSITSYNVTLDPWCQSTNLGDCIWVHQGANGTRWFYPNNMPNVAHDWDLSQEKTDYDIQASSSSYYFITLIEDAGLDSDISTQAHYLKVENSYYKIYIDDSSISRPYWKIDSPVSKTATFYGYTTTPCNFDQTSFDIYGNVTDAYWASLGDTACINEQTIILDNMTTSPFEGWEGYQLEYSPHSYELPIGNHRPVVLTTDPLFGEDCVNNGKCKKIDLPYWGPVDNTSYSNALSFQVPMHNWKKFVEYFNQGCFVDWLEENDIHNPDSLKLSSSMFRYVPQSNYTTPESASVITTYEEGAYLNYADIKTSECKDFDGNNYVSTGIRDSGDIVVNEFHREHVRAIKEGNDSLDIAISDQERVGNPCVTDYKNPLRIKKSGSTSVSNGPSTYLAQFEALDNMITGETDKNVLALNYSTGASGEDANFASFFYGDDSVNPVRLGEIEMIDSSLNVLGVQFSSPGKDYAEYMLKQDPSQLMKPGDVVGLFGGELSLNTEGADTIMVISSAPIIVGNYPGDDVKHLYELIAFLGQVPVKVIGDVNPGDILIPSGKSDGSAIAIHENDLLSHQLPLIIGRAWEGYSGSDIAYVNTLIGFSFNVDIVNRYIEKSSKRLDQELESNQRLEADLDAYLKKQQDLIHRLQKALSMNKE